MQPEMKTLVEMLKYRRPQGNKTQEKFCESYLAPVMECDEFGNYIKIIGDNPNVAFMAHHDTVHSTGSMQKVLVEKSEYDDYIATAPNSNCLGADCTTGVWLILEMIEAGIEGVYVVHAAEEIGCLGSKALVEKFPKWILGIDFAISFDRYGYKSIITHQMGMRTCSEAFAESLASILPDLDLVPDNGGSYTDSNEYVDHVAECTNLSVGYFSQHTRNESQNLTFAMELRDALIQADWSKLVKDREPGTTEYDSHYWYNDEPNRYANLFSTKYEEILDIVRSNPEAVADYLESFGITPEDLYNELDIDRPAEEYDWRYTL